MTRESTKLASPDENGWSEMLVEMVCRPGKHSCHVVSAYPALRIPPAPWSDAHSTEYTEPTPNFGLRRAAFSGGRWRVKWLVASWCTLAAQQGGRVPCHGKRCVMGKSGEPTHTSHLDENKSSARGSPEPRLLSRGSQ